MKLPYCIITGYSKIKGCCKSTCKCIKNSIKNLCKRKTKYVDIDEGNKHFNHEDEYSSSNNSQVVFPIAHNVNDEYIQQIDRL